MKPASIYPLWWNPWGDRGLDFDKKVSISIDNLDHDKSADYKILFLAEPLAILPTVSEGACLLYTSPSPRDKRQSRMPSSA